MSKLAQFKLENPAYKDVPDNELANALYDKYYSNIPREDFNNQMGLTGKQNISRLEASATTAAQGATLGFADEILAGTQALGAKVLGGKDTLSNYYKDAIGQERERVNLAREKYPVQSFATEVAGSIPTSVGTLNALGLGNKLVRGGLALGAVSGLGQTEDITNSKQTAQDIFKDALMGGVTGGIFKLTPKIYEGIKGTKNILKPIKNGFNARSPEELDAVKEMLRNKSSRTYEAMREANAKFRPQASSRIVNQLNASLVETGKINKKLHSDTLAVLKDLNLENKNRTLDLEGLDQYRQLFSGVVSKNTDIAGKMNPDALKASKIIDKIDTIVNELHPNYLLDSGDPNAIKLLNQARKEWQVKSKFETVANIIKKADGDRDKIKSGLKRFVDNPKNLRGFTKDEIHQLKIASKNNFAENILKQAGKVGFDVGSGVNSGNSIIPIGSIIVGGSAGGIATSVGTVARQVSKYMARGKADEALKLIQNSGVPVKEVLKKIPSTNNRNMLSMIISTNAINNQLTNNNIVSDASATERFNFENRVKQLIENGATAENAIKQAQQEKNRFYRNQ